MYPDKHAVLPDVRSPALAPNAYPMTTSAPLSDRMREIAPFRVMEVVERARQLEAEGRSIVHMEIGQPDFGAPRQVVDSAVRALQTLPLGYTTTPGIPELRDAISAWYTERFGVTVPRERIAVTVGASGAFLAALGALVNPGDEVLMADPCYPCNRHFVRMFEGRARLIPVDARQGYQPSATDIARHWSPSTRGVLIATPSNPTGTSIAQPALQAIRSEVMARGGYLVVDEIYQGLSYTDDAHTALALGDDVIIINSFSKYFCMTGWRLGWIVTPAALMQQVEKLAQSMFICPPVPAQFGALSCFRQDTLATLEERRREFRRRRDFLVPALKSLGFSIPVTPDGAFYVYADCSPFSTDSSAFSAQLLEIAGVATAPGCDFGDHRASEHIRFAYTRSMEELERGVSRLRKFLRAG